ncbi:lipopolysaccharide assembly protein LapA domain-containing protein [Williamsia sp. CHRR-6]|uniref:lipopolysaccharide assembly protein LapA domain-containing protein n=1 Tax=Williamsia sp. CHRR-6 TaxID=2835871 RepID=UPI001BD964D7|nr:lipopolysaccharide assembly protein LapA domain-containing protein [Williamsia sp. CHRR-6]MBT0568382.1 DUF1049 domain-containing protein [Williamsia sp. CHRR-6]
MTQRADSAPDGDAADGAGLPPAAVDPDTDISAARRALRGVKYTRTASAWAGLITGAALLILLLVFILQNLESQQTHLLFWTVSLPQGVGLLIAAAVGALVAGVVGAARIHQVKRAIKKA